MIKYSTKSIYGGVGNVEETTEVFWFSTTRARDDLWWGFSGGSLDETEWTGEL